MRWIVRSLGPDQEVLAQLQDSSDKGAPLAGLLFAPRTGLTLVNLGAVGQLQIQDTESFFSRAVVVKDQAGQEVLVAKVGWSDRCSLWLPQLGQRADWDFVDLSDTRLIKSGDEPIVQFEPQKKENLEVEVTFPALSLASATWEGDTLQLLATIGFYLILYRHQESLQVSASYQKLWTDFTSSAKGCWPLLGEAALDLLLWEAPADN